MPTRHLTMFLISVLLINFSCKNSKDNLPEKGVSFALNAYRKKTIANIQYAVELAIPAKKSEKIIGMLKLRKMYKKV